MLVDIFSLDASVVDVVAFEGICLNIDEYALPNPPDGLVNLMRPDKPESTSSLTSGALALVVLVVGAEAAVVLLVEVAEDLDVELKYDFFSILDGIEVEDYIGPELVIPGFVGICERLIFMVLVY